MNKASRISAFIKLGEIMSDAASDFPSSAEAIRFREIMNEQFRHNPWFTPENVRNSVGAISSMLTKERLNSWLQRYIIDEGSSPGTVAVIMAGNIPLVGFHDFLCVLISGRRILAKASSKDLFLIRALAEILIGLEKGFNHQIQFTDRLAQNFDAVIATGSNNSVRYFDYHFSHKAHIFRKNRNSIAIITSDTTKKQLKELGNDIFSYFGLGCRNVSKIYLEKGLDPSDISSHWSNMVNLKDHSSYQNNLKYNRALMEMNSATFIDTGFLLLREDNSLDSAIGVLHYEYYSNAEKLREEIDLISDGLQCTVSENHIPFGQTQSPFPWDYADNIDTLEFLLSL